MRWISYRAGDGSEGVGLATKNGHRGLTTTELGSDLLALIQAGPQARDRAAETLSSAPLLDAPELLPVLPRPPKLICIGLNYASHSEESGFKAPEHPTVFARWSSSLVAHGQPIIRPKISEQLDYEGELAVVIGRGGRAIAEADAFDHVAGYAIFNDASIREIQLRTPQWTLGKNFDGTGAFGPELVTPDELPPGARGLTIVTRLNGEEVQRASTDDLIFDVARLIALMSEAMTLEAGDVIVTGTPAGVGAARTPPLWMKSGDRCEVEIERIGTLSNPIEEER